MIIDEQNNPKIFIILTIENLDINIEDDQIVDFFVSVCDAD